MTRKRFLEEAALDLLRQIDLDLTSRGTVEMAIRTAGISEATYYKWRKLYGGRTSGSALFQRSDCRCPHSSTLTPLTSSTSRRNSVFR
jgi:hypothetical protein